MTLLSKALPLLAAAAIAPASLADTVLIGTQFRSILAYDTDTGGVTFLGVCAGPVHSMAAIGTTLYLGDDFGSVYGFDLDTNLLTGAFPISVDAAAMTTDGQWLYVADTDGEIQKIDPETGAVVASVDTGFFSLTSLAVHWGHIYHGGLSTIAERANLHDDFSADAFQWFTACGSQINSMAFAGLEVMLGGIDGRIYRYDETVGAANGYYQAPVDSVAMVALTGNRALIADSNGRLIETDRTTGAILRDIHVGEPIGAMLALDVGAACPVDLDLSGTLDLGDVQLFIRLVLQDRLGADLNNDGVIDIADLNRFVSDFLTGCN
jgi:hypothetical protein